MSLEVGAGIKRQGRGGISFRGWGQRRYFGAPFTAKGEGGEAYSFVVKGAFLRDVRDLKIVLKTLHTSSIISSCHYPLDLRGYN